MNAPAQLTGISDDNAVEALRELLRERRRAAGDPPPTARPATTSTRPASQDTAIPARTAPLFNPSDRAAAPRPEAERNRWLGDVLAAPQAPPQAPADRAGPQTLLARAARLQLRGWQLALLALLMVLALAAQMFTPAELSALADSAAKRSRDAYTQILQHPLFMDEGERAPAADPGAERSDLITLRAENTALRERLELIEAQIAENSIAAGR